MQAITSLFQYIISIFLWIFSFFYTPTSDAPILMTFETTPCLGTCPVYKATIHDDGFVIYTETYERQFEKRFYLTPKELNDIRQAIVKADFFNLKSNYDDEITDLPATIVTIENKRVRARYHIPERLAEMNETIHQAVTNHI